MFEDQQPTTGKGQGDPSTQLGAGQGTGGPVIEPVSQPQPVAQPVVSPVQEEKKVEDIFGHIDKDAAAVPPTNAAPISGGIPTMAAAPTGGSNKMIPIIAVVVILVLMLGAGAYFAWNWYQSTKTVGANAEKAQQVLATDEEMGQAKGDVVPQEVIATVPATVDSDSDGLTDAEEIMAGTNPMEVDTDKDGLFDYDEIKVYLTNPLLADTDGDGYLDGDEVKSGFDPKGPGKLLNLQDELMKINGVN
jgi:hypothetical protein